MGSIMLWGIGILIYLLIGLGVGKATYINHEDDYDEGDRRIGFIFGFLLWPFEFGALIVRASIYYATRISIYRSNKWRHGNISPDTMLHQVIEMRAKVDDIEKILGNIEKNSAKE
jgi:hypothetical protein